MQLRDDEGAVKNKDWAAKVYMKQIRNSRVIRQHEKFTAFQRSLS